MNFTHFYIPPPHRHKHIFPFKYLVNFDFFFDFFFYFFTDFSIWKLSDSCFFFTFGNNFTTNLQYNQWFNKTYMYKRFKACNKENVIFLILLLADHHMGMSLCLKQDVLPCLTLSVVIEICLQWIHSIRLLNSKLWLHFL